MNCIAFFTIYFSFLNFTSADIPTCYKEDVSWTSPDILDILVPVPDPSQCQVICQDVAGCTAWTWTSAENLDAKLHCILFQSVGNKTSWQESVSGPVSCTCSSQYACTADEENELEVVTNVEEEIQCQSLCSDNISCKFFTWYDSSSFLAFTCFLLRTCDKIDDACTGCFTGLPVCSTDIQTTSTISSTNNPVLKGKKEPLNHLSNSLS